MSHRTSTHAPQDIRGARGSGWAVTAVQIAGLWALAVAQPLFDLLARQPEALLAHDLAPIRIIALTLLFALGVPALGAATLALLHRLSPRLARALGSLTIALLGAVLAMMIVARLGTPPPVVHAAVAVVLGAVLAIAARQQPAVRAMLTVLAVAAVVCPLVFLAAPSLRGLLRPHEPDIATGANADVTGTGAAPVVMVVFDEWPLASLLAADGTINAARYPHLARFAARSHWFRNATTVAHSTAYAVPAILSGRYPDDYRLPIAADYPQNLFTLLAQAGYALNVTEPHTDLCPESLCPEQAPETTAQVRSLVQDLRIVYLHLVLPRAWRDRLPTVGESWRGFAQASPSQDIEPPNGPTETRGIGEAKTSGPTARPTAREWASGRSWKPRPVDGRTHHRDPAGAYRAFVEGIEPHEQPTLHFLHVLLPHMPWRHLPDGRRYERPSAPREPHGLARQMWHGTPFEALQGQQRHLLQVAFTDRLVGELMRHLASVGLFDDALIVLVADHGAAFVAGRPRRNLTQGMTADLANVPLMIKMPGQTSGVIDDRNAATIDIVPTVARALGLPVASPVDGHDLMAAPSSSTTKVTYRSGLAGAGHGRPLEFDTATMVEERGAVVQRIAEHFGRRPQEVYRLGDVDGLVGQRLGDIAIASTPTTVAVSIDQRQALTRVDLDTEPIPARLTGGLETETRSTSSDAPDPSPPFQPRRLAVAMGGVIRAVTETHLDAEDRERFSVVVDPSALRPGNNPVRLFEISGPPGRPTLAPIEPRADPAFETFTSDFESGEPSAWTTRVGAPPRARQP